MTVGEFYGHIFQIGIGAYFIYLSRINKERFGYKMAMFMKIGGIIMIVYNIIDMLISMSARN